MLFHIAFHQPAISKYNIGDRDDVVKNHKNLITSFDCKQMGPSRVGNCTCTAGTLGPKGDGQGTSPQNNVMLLGFCHLILTICQNNQFSSNSEAEPKATGSDKWTIFILQGFRALPSLLKTQTPGGEGL